MNEPAFGPAHRKSILLLGPAPPPKGGVSIHIERLSRKLASHGLAHSIVDESRYSKPGIINLRQTSLRQYISTLRRHGIAHIHSSNHFVRLLHTLVARTFGLRVIHTVHSARGSWLSIKALRLACRLGHVRIGVSKAVADIIGKRVQIIPAFIAPGQDDEEIPAEIVAWLRAQTKSGRRIIAMNAFNTAKICGVDLYGLDMVVTAFDNERLAHRHAALICVSNAEPEKAYFESLISRVAERGLDDRIRFVKQDVSFAGILRRCDVFVRPTITDGDALSVREALWYGKPAIASDAAVRPPGTILFRSRDVSQLVEKILSARSAVIPVSERRDFADNVIRVYEVVAAA